MDNVLEFSKPDISPPPDLIAEANHRISNSLAILVGMVRMQAAGVRKSTKMFSGADVRLMLDGIAARIHTISQLHRLLCHTGEADAFSLRPHLKDVTDALVSSLSSPEHPIQVEHTGCDSLILMRHVQPIVLILCEIFINAVKYAHPAGVPLHMSVDCVSGADGRLELTIQDDGVGLPDGFDTASGGGLGFRVMRSLAGEIGAQLQVMDTGLGLRFTLFLPASSQATALLA